MKQFETGKIYVNFNYCGEYCCAAEYYLIEKKSDKSIWVRKAQLWQEYYGRVNFSKDQAINIDPAVLEFSDIQRSKLCSLKDHEYFVFTDKEFDIKHYIFSEYCKEIGGN